MALIWKVVETMTVDAETLEEFLNAYTADGWDYYGMQFAMKPNSKRPAMAFVLFIVACLSRLSHSAIAAVYAMSVAALLWITTAVPSQAMVAVVGARQI